MNLIDTTGAISVIQLAELGSDPTDKGIIVKGITILIGVLMLFVAGGGAWMAWNHFWADGKGGDMKGFRTIALRVLAAEAFLGGVIWIANQGTDLIPRLGG